MKTSTIATYCLLLLSFVGSQSCKSTKTVSTQRINTPEETVVEVRSDPQKTQINRFVPVESIAELKPGMTIDEVTAVLKGRPYNLISSQSDGHHIVQYKYRLTQLEVPAGDVNNDGIEKKVNKTFYTGDMQDLYIVFNGAGKLDYLVTSQGGLSEKLLRDNNLLYVIKKDKDKFAADPDKNYRLANGEAFTPMLACKNCDAAGSAAPSARPNASSKPAKAKGGEGDDPCSGVAELSARLDDAEAVVVEMFAFGEAKKGKDELKKVLDLEKRYAESNKDILRLSKSIDANPASKECPGYASLDGRQKQIAADYKKYSETNKKGGMGKMLGKALGGL